MSDQEFETRAAHRRVTMQGGTARSFQELEEKGFEFWASAEPGMRLQAMWDALVEAWVIEGKRGPPPRFQGSTFGIGRFER